MTKKLQAQIRKRARGLCEYCRIPADRYRTPFQIDHIIARQHGGKTIESNLALCCMECNLRKGPNLSGIDPKSRRHVRLFDPRHDTWGAHFRWRDAEIIGLTSIGRTSAFVLDLNNPARLAVRRSLIEEGDFPE